MMKIETTTNSPQNTANFAQKMGEKINFPVCIAFFGDLGAGKTCFTAGLSKGLGYNGDVTSPTFAIINEYLGGRLPIFHFDLYRIHGEEELYSLGFYDYADREGVMVLEWAENVPINELCLENLIKITITVPDENTRKLTIEGEDKLLKELVPDENIGG